MAIELLMVIFVGVFVMESDVAAFTINAVDDPRTLYKVLYLRPPGNVYSINELVELWETKIGKKLEKSYVPGEELLKSIKGNFLVCLHNISIPIWLLL